MASDAPSPAPPPGTVWWCDGASLAFDPYYKRRPVVVVAEEEGGLLAVIPLSSRRRHGQETAVTHDRGVSYMTGAVLRVERAALVKPLGAWEGFPAWYAAQLGDGAPPPPGFFGRFSLWLRVLFCLDRGSELR